MNERNVLKLLAAFMLAVMFWQCGGTSEDGQEEGETATPQVSKVVVTSGKVPQLALDEFAQELAGLEIETLTAQSMQPEMIAYGRLEEDPAQAFVLRAPVTGTLSQYQERRWPAIGQRIGGGTIIGIIEPRFSPADRIALSGQLSAALSDLNASKAEVAASRSAYERLRVLNADRKNVSDRVVEEAQARLQAAEAKLQGARETAELIESSLRSEGPAERKPLVMPRDGDVVAIMAQPGESIESGAPILRVTRLDRLWARVDVPPGEHIPASISAARVIPLGYEKEPIAAVAVGLNTETDPKQQGQSFLLRLVETRFGLRPGLAVTAYLTIPGEPRRGVIIPLSAVVHFTGKTFAYVQTGGDRFMRREVSTEHPVNTGYFMDSGFAPGDRVVVTGAQALLSEEFKSQTEIKEGS